MSATKVSPQDLDDVKTWGDGEENAGKSRKRHPTRARSIMKRQDTVHHNHLKSADISVMRSRPHYSEDDTRTHVAVHFVIKKIRKIDFVNSNVDLRFILSLQWKHEKLKGFIADSNELWTPSVTILNADQLTQQSLKPWFYPEHGVIRQNIVFEGTIGNENDFSDFPFDMDSFRILAVVEIDTGDDMVKITYNKNKTINDIVPAYNKRQMTEFQLHTELTTVYRVKRPESNLKAEPGQDEGKENVFHLMGVYNAIDLKIYLSRHYGFYLWKVMLILTMVCFLSWIVFWLDEFQARIEIGLTLFLSAVAFLYIVSDSLPKLGFLTTIDIMVLACFFNIFLTILETFIVFHVVEDAQVKGKIDDISKYVFPVAFIFCTYGIMFKSMKLRHKRYHEIKNSSDLGISKDLYE